MTEKLTRAEVAEKVHSGEMTSIYHMKLHESFQRNGLVITRVPGGWIYQCYQSGNQSFIPYSTEFNDTIWWPNLELEHAK